MKLLLEVNSVIHSRQ